MRIAMGGIVHETNTFAVESFGPTGLGSFTVGRGDEILGWAGGRTYLGGMIDAAQRAGYELVPILHASAQPSGTIEADVYHRLKTELVQGIAAALPVDAVVLDTHGAGVADGIHDLEADLGRAIRDVVGPELPVITTLDLHGTITEAMNQVFDLMLGVYDYPHVDMYERGVEAIDAATEIASGRLRPTTHVEFLPMLIPTSTTDVAPAADIRRRCLDMQDEPGYLRGAFFHGFPYTDTPIAGASVVVTTHDDPERARRVALDLAAEIWARRDDFRTESLTPEIALRQAVSLVGERGGPVVVNDTADNPGGGAPGDSTHVLRAVLDADLGSILNGVCFGFIYDPETASQAVAAGPGAEIEVVLGGRHDELHGDSITGPAYVKAVSDGRFVQSTPMLRGVPRSLGPMARLRLGGDTAGRAGHRGAVDVIVGSKRSQVFDPVIFTLHGVDVTTYDLVVLKSSQHFRAGFTDLATAIVTADSPGLSTLRVDNFDHRRLDGPRWPLDPEVTWLPEF